MFLGNGMRYPRNSNGYPHIFDDARATGDTADIVRRQPTTVIQNGGSKPEVECFSVRNEILPKFQRLPQQVTRLTLSDAGWLLFVMVD